MKNKAINLTPIVILIITLLASCTFESDVCDETKETILRDYDEIVADAYERRDYELAYYLRQESIELANNYICE